MQAAHYDSVKRQRDLQMPSLENMVRSPSLPKMHATRLERLDRERFHAQRWDVQMQQERVSTARELSKMERRLRRMPHSYGKDVPEATRRGTPLGAAVLTMKRSSTSILRAPSGGRERRLVGTPSAPILPTMDQRHSSTRDVQAARFGPEQVARAVAASGEPCPPQRTAYLMSVYDPGSRGYIERVGLEGLLTALRGTSTTNLELRHAWNCVVEAEARLHEMSDHFADSFSFSADDEADGEVTPCRSGCTTSASASQVVPTPNTLPPLASAPMLAAMPPALPMRAPSQGALANEAPSQGALANEEERLSPLDEAGGAPLAGAPALIGVAAARRSGNSQATTSGAIKASKVDVKRPIAEQLRTLLLDKVKRTIDVFREWDKDNNNSISYAEFERAMTNLGIALPKEFADIWAALDVDGSGQLTYHELLSVLDPSRAPSGPSGLAMDPHNQRGEWQYERTQQDAAAGLIERRDQSHGAYAADVSMHSEQVDRHFTTGYLRSDEVSGLATGPKPAPKPRTVGKLPGMRVSSSSSAGGGGGDAARQQLREAFARTAYARVIDVFHSWDTDEDGAVSRGEFAKAVACLGLNSNAAEIDALFSQLDTDGDGYIQYSELDDALRPGYKPPTRQARKPEPAPTGLTPFQLKQRAAQRQARRHALARSTLSGTSAPELTTGTINMKRPIAEQLRTLLLDKVKRTIDVFREWDKDNNNSISYAEFERAMTNLGIALPKEFADIWAALDVDGSGQLTYHELLSVLDPSRAPSGPSGLAMDPHNQRGEWQYERTQQDAAAGLIERRDQSHGAYAADVSMHSEQVDRHFTTGYLRSDEVSGLATGPKPAPKPRTVGKLPGMRVSSSSSAGGGGGDAARQQLREAFARTAYARVIDVFHSWDTDEDGAVSRGEFAKAVACLGLNSNAAEIDALFSQLDTDGDGYIQYSELEAAFRKDAAAARTH